MKIKKLSTGQISILENDGTTRIKVIQPDSDWTKDIGQNAIVVYGKTVAVIPVSEVTATIINDVETPFDPETQTIDDLMAIFESFFFKLSGGGGDGLTAYQELTFDLNNPRVKLDSNKTLYEVILLNQDITLEPDLNGAKTGFETYLPLKGNGTNNIDFGVFENADISKSFDNSADLVNYLVLYQVGEKFKYKILEQYYQDTTPPTLLSAYVKKDTPTIWELTLSEALNNSSIPAFTDFVIYINSVSDTITDLSIINDKIYITGTTDVVPGDVLTFDYTAGTNTIKDLAGNNFANQTGTSVTNQTASILDIPEVIAYFVAKNSAEFTLSGNDVTSWINRSTAGNLNASGGQFRTFDSIEKAVVTGATSNQYLNLNTPVNLGNVHTIVLYEKYTYINTTTTFLGKEAELDYIGEGSSNRFQYSSDAGIDYFDKGSVPSGVRKHVIRRNAGSLTWELNDVSLNHSTDAVSVTPSGQFRFAGLGFSTFLNLQETKALVIATTELTNDQINNIVIPELDAELGL